jgi:hypothetical protein
MVERGEAAYIEWIDELFHILGISAPGDDESGPPRPIKLPDGRTCRFGPRHVAPLQALYREGHAPAEAARLFMKFVESDETQWDRLQSFEDTDTCH